MQEKYHCHRLEGRKRGLRLSMPVWWRRRRR